MIIDIIQVQYPVLDHTESVANIGITAQSVTVANGIKVADAFSNKNNSLFLVIENSTVDSDSEGVESAMTVKAGNAYPNSMLGDITIELPAGTSAIQVQDLSRFEQADGSLLLDFGESFEGSIYAVAKWAGVAPVVA